ncbi:hypothetical protein SAMN04488101_101145 [Pedobacter nyackensis]|uniref:Uncharacterized protein n=1 Tax=Pedobacter nyackensis TaxID=475255 RepID=A0A1W1ZYK8_9SPHI|nr:hypothetical protein SAMN04488101_101145 [Pedobacter nyackensis]
MEMTWDNYVLYLASIPKHDDEVDTADKGQKPEVKEAWDLF